MNEAIYEEHEHEESCCASGTCGLSITSEDDYHYLADYDFINTNPEGFQIHE